MKRNSRLSAVLLAATAVSTALANPGGPVVDVAPSVAITWTSVAAKPMVDLCYNSIAGEYLVAFMQTAPGDPNFTHIWVQRMAPDGSLVGTAVALDQGTGPCVAFAPTGGGRYMVCYEGAGSRGIAKCFAPDLSGITYGSQDRLFLANLVDSGSASAPDIAFDGTNFVAVWQQWYAPVGTILARRFDPLTGAQVETGTGLTVDTGTCSNHPCLTYLGGAAGKLLVAFENGPNNAANREIRSRTLSFPGPVVGASQLLSTVGPATAAAGWPRAAASVTSQEWLVAWDETSYQGSWAGVQPYSATPVTFGSVAFRRVNAAGTAQGATETVLAASAAGSIDVAPFVAWSDVDNRYIVNWQRGAATTASAIRENYVVPGTGAIVNASPTVFHAPSGAPFPFTPAVAVKSGSQDYLSAWGGYTDVGGTPYLRFQARSGSTNMTQPNPVSGLGQFQPDGQTPISPGTTSRGPSFVAKALVSDPEGLPVTLNVWVAPVPTAFAVAPTTSVTAPNGSIAEVLVGGLSVGTNYHWKVQAVDYYGNPGAAVSFGTNPELNSEVDFTAGSNLAPVILSMDQLNATTGRPIDVGQAMADPVEFKVAVTDADADPVRLEVEVASTAYGFSGYPTAVSAYSTGGTASVVFGIPSGEYHWRCRVSDAGGPGGWTSFGGNPETAADLRIVLGSRNDAKGCLASAADASLPRWMAILLLLPLVLLRRTRERGGVLVASALLLGLVACSPSASEEGLPPGPAPSTPPIPAPVAVNDAYGTNEDVVLTVAAPGVMTNDANYPAAAVMIASPVYGSIAFSSSGAFVYTPYPNYHGPDSFTYRVVGGTTGFYATVTLTIASVPDPPTAVDDGYAANGSIGIHPVAPGVLGNDSFAEISSGTKTALLVTNPSHAAVFILNPNGSFTYGSASGWTGDDTFTYRCVDGPYQSAPATVLVQTLNPNTAPTAVNDAATTDMDVPVAIMVIANDSDPELMTLTPVVVAPPAHGTFDGTTYTPVAGYSGPDSFTYTANDGILNSNVATVNINVKPFDGTLTAAYGMETAPNAGLLRFPDVAGPAKYLWQAAAGWQGYGFTFQPGTTFAWTLLKNGAGAHELRKVDVSTKVTTVIGNPILPAAASGLAFDSTGKLYTVADKVYSLNTTTGAATALSPALPGSMLTLAAGKGDQLYLLQSTSSVGATWIYRFDPTAPATVPAWAPMPAGADADGNNFAAGEGIAADANGNVYVASNDGTSIFKCNDADASGSIDKAGETTVFATIPFDPSFMGTYYSGLSMSKSGGLDVLLANVSDGWAGDPNIGVWKIAMNGTPTLINPAYVVGLDGSVVAGPR